MPYQCLQDLSASVREYLPQHAQKIYQAAYNSAWDEYDYDEGRSLHCVASAAVKDKYEKNEVTGNWEAKSE